MLVVLGSAVLLQGSVGTTAQGSSGNPAEGGDISPCCISNHGRCKVVLSKVLAHGRALELEDL